MWYKWQSTTLGNKVCGLILESLGTVSLQITESLWTLALDLDWMSGSFRQIQAWLHQDHLEHILQSTSVLVLASECLIRSLWDIAWASILSKTTTVILMHSQFCKVCGQGLFSYPACPIRYIYLADHLLPSEILNFSWLPWHHFILAPLPLHCHTISISFPASFFSVPHLNVSVA